MPASEAAGNSKERALSGCISDLYFLGIRRKVWKTRGSCLHHKPTTSYQKELWLEHNSHSVSVIDSGSFFGRMYFMVKVEVMAVMDESSLAR